MFIINPNFAEEGKNIIVNVSNKSIALFFLDQEWKRTEVQGLLLLLLLISAITIAAYSLYVADDIPSENHLQCIPPLAWGFKVATHLHIYFYPDGLLLSSEAETNHMRKHPHLHKIVLLDITNHGTLST